MSLQASTVVDLLYAEAKYLNIDFIFNHKIESIQRVNQKFIINNIEYQKLLVSSGSKAVKRLGGNDSGYKIASFFNHTIIDTFDTLVQLISNEKFLKEISGVKLIAQASLYIDNSFIIDIKGDILFTQYGLSGSAILDISRDVSYALTQHSRVKIIIDLLPTFSKQGLINLLEKRVLTLKSRDLSVFLEGILNKKLATLILNKLKIDSRAQELNKKDIQKISYEIKNLSFLIIETKGYDSCEAVAGGVCLDEIDMKTMESKIVNNLYFSGEVLDVDGDCGGYNLHFAWSSGIIAGNNISKV